MPPSLAFWLPLLLGCPEYSLDKQESGGEPYAIVSLDPAILDFGAVATGETATRSFTVSDVGRAALTVESIRIQGSGAFSLWTSMSQFTLAPGERAELVVTYAPASVEDRGQVVVTTDDALVPQAIVDLLGTWLAPGLTLDPPTLDFGVVGMGATGTRTVRVINSGGVALDVDLVAATGDGFSTAPFDPFTLEPGEEAPMETLFTPPWEGSFNGDLWVDCPALSSPGRVPLSGATAGPIAVCDASPNPAQARVDGVTWTGEGSYDTAGSDLVDWSWTLTTRPDGSAATLPESRSMEIPGFHPDVLGTYEAELVVTDALGIHSAPCVATLEAFTTHSLWIELYWSHRLDDLDLHLLAPGGTLWTSTDCHWQNCTEGGLDWGVAGDVSDDPALDTDDLFESGPENAYIMDPAEGRYEVWVHDFPGSVYQDANDATVTVYVDGVLAWTGTKTFTGEDEILAFAAIDWESRMVEGL